MAMINRKNFIKSSAERRFTDRLSLREAFRNKYNYAKSNLDSGTAPCVLSFYGVGGIGKTSLLKTLEKELRLEKQKNALCIYHDIHDDTSADRVTILKRLRGRLSADYGYNFNMFDWGYYCYQKAIGEDVEKPETASFIKSSKFLNCVIGLIKDSPIPIPYGDWITKIVDGVDQIVSFVSAADDGLTMIRQYVHDNKKELTQMTAMDKDGLYNILPQLFAMDMERNLEKATEPFVFFIDTYEKLVNELSGVGNPLKDDLWLRDENGPIQNISKAIWVICGREMLKWKDIGDCGWREADENNLEQHRIGGLSEYDSCMYLEDCGIDDVNLRKSLYNLTKGTPLYLDLCVTQYEYIKAGDREPVEEDFGKDTTQLVDRMLQYMNDDEKQMVFILACLKKWDYDLFVSVIKAFNMSVINDKYDAIMSMSFIEEDASREGYYRINRVLGKVLLENCNERTKDGSLKAAIDFCLEHRKDDPVHYAEMAMQYAVAYYKDDMDLKRFCSDNLAGYLSELTMQGKESSDKAKYIFEPFSERAENNKNDVLYLQKLFFISGYCKANGDYKTSFDYAKKSVELSKELNGENHSETLMAMNNLANVYLHLGEHAKALELSELVVEKYKEYSGENHCDTLASMNTLANAYLYIGEYKKALELFEIISEKFKELFGENHHDTLAITNNLANTYSYLGEYKKALELFGAVAEKQKVLLGENHPDTLNSICNIAGTYSHLGENEKSLELNEYVLEKSKEVLGENHPKTLLSMNNLANVYFKLGEHAKALKLLNSVIEKCKVVFNEYHPHTLGSMNNLASIYTELGDNKKAIELLGYVAEKQKEIFGDNHPDTLTSMNNLALAYSNLGEHRKACGIYTVVLEQRKKVLGENHSATLNVMNNLAFAYIELGEYKKALVLCRELYSQFKKQYGERNENAQAILSCIRELERVIKRK